MFYYNHNGICEKCPLYHYCLGDFEPARICPEGSMIYELQDAGVYNVRYMTSVQRNSLTEKSFVAVCFVDVADLMN